MGLISLAKMINTERFKHGMGNNTMPRAGRKRSDSDSHS